MATIIFTAASRRLSVRGPFGGSDVDVLVDAVQTFSRTCPGLVLDLSRVSAVSRPVAESIVRCCEAGDGHGRPVRIRLRPESAVERMFRVVSSIERSRTLGALTS
jgi:hypothetical protein